MMEFSLMFAALNLADKDEVCNTIYIFPHFLFLTYMLILINVSSICSEMLLPWNIEIIINIRTIHRAYSSTHFVIILLTPCPLQFLTFLNTILHNTQPPVCVCVLFVFFPQWKNMYHMHHFVPISSTTLNILNSYPNSILSLNFEFVYNLALLPWDAVLTKNNCIKGLFAICACRVG